MASAPSFTTDRIRNVVVVGAGNSAGQAALFFANHASKVTLLVRGDSLEKSMSHYLIEQLPRAFRQIYRVTC